MAARVGMRRFIWNALISFAAVCFPVIPSYTIMSFLCHSFHLQWSAGNDWFLQTTDDLCRCAICIYKNRLAGSMTSEAAKNVVWLKWQQLTKK